MNAELRAVETERATLLAGSGPAAILTADSPADAFRASSLMVRRATVGYLVKVTLARPRAAPDLRPGVRQHRLEVTASPST